MSDRATVYRDHLVRVVRGANVAAAEPEANPGALASVTRRLIESEDALAILRAKGYGRPGQSLAAVASAVPPAMNCAELRAAVTLTRRAR